VSLRRAVAAAIPALVVLAAVLPIGSAAPAGAGGRQSGSSTSTTALRDVTTTTEGGGRREPLTQPIGQIAYLSLDGGVWIAEGDDPPERIGDGAALGPANQGAVVVSPEADLVAWARTDGSLVTAPLSGGPLTVVATDVALDWLGREPIIAWDSQGEHLAYIAKGTAEMVPPADSQPRALEDPESFPVPLPTGVYGNVVKTVTRKGGVTSIMGVPTERSFIGINWSLIDPLMVLESVIPGSEDRYTLLVAAGNAEADFPSPLSADDPDFAPDGSFLVAVGPSKGRQELIRVALDDLEQKVLVVDDRICNPLVSPDATRIVYAAGEHCERIKLISSKGGRSFDITPTDVPDTANFSVAELGWTTDGRFLSVPHCREVSTVTTCNGPVLFLEPDSGRVLAGPEFDAATVAPIRRPLVQEVWVDIDLRGPLQFRGSFLVDESIQGALSQSETGGGSLEAELANETMTLGVKLTAERGMFVAGTLTAVDPEQGIDRQFLALGRVQLLGARILQISGVWYVTDDLPFATGEFNIAVRRR
jgi:hypothetical protein